MQIKDGLACLTRHTKDQPLFQVCFFFSITHSTSIKKENKHDNLETENHEVYNRKES